MSKEFWMKWVEADEVEKEKLVSTLPLFADGSIKCPLFSVNVVNSYFEDLFLFMRDKGTKIFIKKGEVKKEDE